MVKYSAPTQIGVSDSATEELHALTRVDPGPEYLDPLPLPKLQLKAIDSPAAGA